MIPTLKVIGSSSAGNSYAIVTKEQTLLLEAGLQLAKVRKEVDLSKVVGCVVTHKHKDHAAYVGAYYTRFPIAAPRSVVSYKKANTICLEDKQPQKIGQFVIYPIEVPHQDADGAPCQCFAYVIMHETFGSFLFVTDTYNLPVVVPKVNHFLIEANYTQDILDKDLLANGITKIQRERIMLSHMSIDNCINIINQCGTTDAKTITLCHLSHRHSQPSVFKSIVEMNTGIPTYIALPGVTVPLIKV